MRFFAAAGFAALVAFVLLGCESNVPTTTTQGTRPIVTLPEKVAEAAKDLRSDYEKKWQQLQDSIAEMNAMAKEKGKEAEAAFHQAVTTLREKQASFDEKLQKAKGLAGDAWDKAKADLDKTWQDLEAAYKDAKSKLE